MKIKRVLKFFFLILGGLVLIPIFYFFVSFSSKSKEIKWGVTFSQKHSQYLKLDWKQNYLALLDELKVRELRLIAYWDLIEPEKGKYNFDDLDWQINEAQNRGARIILIAGMKAPRWPECHIPQWATGIGENGQQEEILDYLKEVILRYKNNSSIWAWQVENEPFFSFGICPWADADFLKKEVELVKSLDPGRPVVVSDSGEMSFWLKPAKIGDIVGTTMYRQVWSKDFNRSLGYPLPPIFYGRKAQIINTFYNKDVICVELQAEPWGAELLYSLPLEEQLKIMDVDKFNGNIEFARKTGLRKFYLWGAEWWYWLKEKQNRPQIWDEAKNLFIP